MGRFLSALLSAALPGPAALMLMRYLLVLLIMVWATIALLSACAPAQPDNPHKSWPGKKTQAARVKRGYTPRYRHVR